MAALSLRAIARELRGSATRLVVFVLSLSVGVASVVAVAGLSRGLDASVRREARRLLAADLAVTGYRPVPDAVDRALGGAVVARASVDEMATMAATVSEGGAPGRSRLVELKAVGTGYPFYGELVTEPPEESGSLPLPDEVWIDPELARELSLGTGSRLRVGSAEFRVARTILAEPDRIEGPFGVGPRVLLSRSGLERTGLEVFGSRIRYRVLFRFPDGAGSEAVEAAADRVRAALPDGTTWEVETAADAQPALRTGMRRAGQYLGLVALLSLLIGGIGVGQTVRAWIASRLDATAVQRCIGFRSRDLVAAYVVQTAVLGAAGSTVGAAIGVLLQALMAAVVEPLVPGLRVSLWQPEAIARGTALGVLVAVAFALPALLEAGRVPPLRVLRRDAEPLPASPPVRAGVFVATASAVFAAAWAQSGSARDGALFVAGVAVVAGLLAAAGRALAWTVARMGRRVPRVWLRNGMAALARPGAGTTGSIVALGLGILVIVGVYLVERRIGEELEAAIPEDAPNAFLLDVQVDQWDDVRERLAATGATVVGATPLVTARLARIDGAPVEEIVSGAEDGSSRRWVLTREQRMTWRESLQEGNTLVAGTLWSDPSLPEISVEEEFARDLRVGVGSTLTFDVQGVPVELHVTSLRRVEWRTFRLNFFLVVEPGALEGAPYSVVAAVRLPVGGEARTQDAVAAAHPNVTVIRVREIFERVGELLSRIAVGIRLLGLFTACAGIAILAGAIAAGSIRRSREVALFKTLGMTRFQVVAVYAVEYALLGLVAGGIGSAGGAGFAWYVLERGMELETTVAPGPALLAVLAAAAVAVAAGLAASAPALSRRPVEVLRRD